MEIVRLLECDGSWAAFEADWASQCQECDDDLENYGSSSIGSIRSFAAEAKPMEWAISLRNDVRIMAIAYAICTHQKPFDGKVLRIREVTVCPLLDHGNLPETAYVDTLIGLLNGAINLSEGGLRAKHIKMHLRSPSDSVFFRAVGNTLDSAGVFASVEAHGAWLTFTKQTVSLAVV